MSSYEITSITGVTVHLEVTLHDTYARVMGRASAGGKTIEGMISVVSDLRANGPAAATPAGKTAIQRGATHIAHMGSLAEGINIGLAADQAEKLQSILAQAQRDLKAAQQAWMDARWDAAERSCPEGHVAAQIVWSNGDLMAACARTRDGIEVLVSDMAESHQGYVWAPVAEVEAARAKAEQRAETRAAEDAALRAVQVPARALAHYRRYRGDAEAAWADDQEGAAMDIRHYGDAIEAQGLGMRPIPRPDALDDVIDHIGG